MKQTESDQKRGGEGILVERKGRDQTKNIMNGPHTWITVWKLTVRVWVGWMEEGKGGITGTTGIE